MVEKRVFFFWGNPIMSWMRYMTLLSFRKLNPDWEVVLYVAKQEIKEKTWSDYNKQDFFNYTGANYFPEVEKLGITIKDWSLEFDLQIGPSQLSNFFKWKILSEKSGLYCDMDILFTKPIDNLYQSMKDYDLVIACEHRYFSIGFLGSSGGNQFYKNVYNNTFKSFDPNLYQSCGVYSIYSHLEKLQKVPSEIDFQKERLWETLEKYYPDMRKYRLPMITVYPWLFNQMDLVFSELYVKLPSDCIGIHWYAGDTISQAFNKLMTHENREEWSNTFNFFAGKVLEGI